MMLYVDCEEGFSKADLQRVEEAFSGFVQADVPLSVELTFVDEEEIHRLNLETRGVDKVTDVLSYPTMEGILGQALVGSEHPFDLDEDGRLVIGSIAICKQRAKEQAEEYGHSYERELHYLLVHGILHCLGYDHIEEEDKVQMRAQEEAILQKLGLRRQEV